MTGFALAAGLDPESLAAEFRQRGRLRIRPFLSDDSARALLDHVRARDDWRLVVNAGEKVFEIDRAGQRAMTRDQWRQLDALVDDAAAREFQFRFETIRVPDEESERRHRGTLLEDFALFMSSPEMVGFFRVVTDCADIAFADAQATRYSAGHFLTAHDDDVDGKGRRAAYVLGLTEEWSPELGGLLQFHDDAGLGLTESVPPAFNALNLFAVPQLHSVTRVGASAPHPRLSITGWLRRRV